MGDAVVVDPSFFSQHRRTVLGVRPSHDVPVHDESAVGTASLGEVMVVLSTREALPFREGKEICDTDVEVLHPRGFRGWIWETYLARVEE